MTTVNRYRLWCSTEEDYRYVWDTAEPSTCPSGVEHSVDSDSITIIDTTGEGSHYTEAGELIIADGHISVDDAGRWVGQPIITASGLATTISDFKIDYDCKVKGAHFWTCPVSGYNSQTTADFQVVDKDDVLGLFDVYGLEQGEVLELTKYVDGSPLAPEFCNMSSFNFPSI